MALNLCVCVRSSLFGRFTVHIKKINNKRTCGFVFPNIDTYSKVGGL